jgi:hypothetical protein
MPDSMVTDFQLTAEQVEAMSSSRCRRRTRSEQPVTAHSSVLSAL